MSIRIEAAETIHHKTHKKNEGFDFPGRMFCLLGRGPEADADWLTLTAWQRAFNKLGGPRGVPT